MKIVIRAGGVGTRLWPISREKKPKQLHALFSNKTMLQEAVERALKVAKPEDIYISGNKSSEKALRNELGAILEGNLLLEPARRDTAAAVGLETLNIYNQDPEAVIASLGSDHVVKNNKEFVRLLKVGEKFLQKHPDYLLCLGIKPTNPDTGMGYIELGEKINAEISTVKCFKEKPDLKHAKKFLAAGNFLWNGNMFMWKAKTIWHLFKKYQPEIYNQLEQIRKQPKLLNKIYPKIEKIAIDYAIMEKAEKIAALPADIGWNDIGDWARLKDELATSETENVIRGQHLGIDCKNTLVFSETERLIATIGLENLVIVDTGDALLIADKYRTQEVKQMVEEIKKQKKEKYL